MPYIPSRELTNYIKRTVEKGENYMNDSQANEFLEGASKILGVEFNTSFDPKSVKEMPKSSFSVSDLISKHRASKYE